LPRQDGPAAEASACHGRQRFLGDVEVLDVVQVTPDDPSIARPPPLVRGHGGHGVRPMVERLDEPTPNRRAADQPGLVLPQLEGLILGSPRRQPEQRHQSLIGEEAECIAMSTPEAKTGSMKPAASPTSTQPGPYRRATW
jgi:hypothetical protein